MYDAPETGKAAGGPRGRGIFGWGAVDRVRLKNRLYASNGLTNARRS